MSASRDKQEVAPQRDFQKVANSITREAVPAGVFNGKAKQLYDCLYALTRGAIVPTRAVRIARSDLMRKSGIGAKVTLEQNLRRLATCGLVTIKTIGGVQGGNEYTVHLPEEATLPSTPPSTGTSPPSPPSGGQKLGLLGTLVSRVPSPGASVEAIKTSQPPKTSSKTEATDDEAFTSLREFEREVTGKATATAAQWAEVFAVIVAEGRLAAARTGTVSNVPAFLAEHLRRRLAKPDAPRQEGKRAPTETAPLAPEEVAPPAPDDVEEFARARAELEGK